MVLRYSAAQFSGGIRVVLAQAVLGYSVTWQGCQVRTMNPIDRRSGGDAAHVQLERYGRSVAWLCCSRRGTVFATECARTDLLRDVDAHALAQIRKVRT